MIEQRVRPIAYLILVHIIAIVIAFIMCMGGPYNQYGYNEGFYTVRDSLGNEWHNMQMCGGGINYARFCDLNGNSVVVRGHYSYEKTSNSFTTKEGK